MQFPKLKNLVRLLRSNAVQASPLLYNGSLLDPTSINSAFRSLVYNAASAAGTTNFATASGTTSTLTSLGSLLQQYTAGSAVTVTLDYAYNIGLSLPAPLSVGQTFTFQIQTNASTTIATPTLSDTAVTLAGTTSVLAAAMRWYQGAITQVYAQSTPTFTTGTTFTSLTQVGSTNAFTVALGTNSVSPTVGQAIYLNITTGTLPTGWYPIVKVTSATSFVIATPAGTAWTATAGTVGNVGTATLALPSNIYSPLITITGLMATVTATMSV